MHLAKQRTRATIEVCDEPHKTVDIRRGTTHHLNVVNVLSLATDDKTETPHGPEVRAGKNTSLASLEAWYDFTETKESAIAQSERCAAFDIFMAAPPKDKAASPVAWLALVVAMIAGVGTWENSCTNRSNRQDTLSQQQQAAANKAIDDRIDAKVSPIKQLIQERKDAENRIGSQVEAFPLLANGLKDQLDGIRKETARANDLAGGNQLEVSKMVGRIDGIEKNVDRLLSLQLKSAAQLPAEALGGQLANVSALYKLAEQRKTEIPADTNNLLRMKLASMNTSQPGFWPLASIVVTAASENLIGGTLQVHGKLQNVKIDGNQFQGITVVLDGIHFSNTRVMDASSSITVVRRIRETTSLRTLFS